MPTILFSVYRIYRLFFFFWKIKTKQNENKIMHYVLEK